MHRMAKVCHQITGLLTPREVSWRTLRIPMLAKITTTLVNISAGLVVIFLVLAHASGAEPTGISQDGDDFFEKRIRPILADRCYKCHSAQAEKLKGGLRLDTREALLRGGESGPALVPGKVNESLLIRAIRYKDEHLQMPPKEKLADTVVADFEQWIRSGAPDPRSGNVGQPPSKAGVNFVEGRKFWSFQPPKTHSLPPVTRATWPQRRIDWFVLAKLDEGGLSTSHRADSRTLIRRATFDLTGLPPTPEELEAFLHDASANAYEHLIERLLASPRYGERWTRFWLDRARYTDAISDFEGSRAAPWLYRDWVMKAFQQDMPYDEFVKRQLATDLMPETSLEEMPALGFLGLSPTYWKELKLQRSLIQTVVAEEWEERMDAVGRTFLGLTLACARCHDHKFDPISQEDYYALAGVLASTRLTDRPLVPEKEFEPVRRARQEAAGLEEELSKLRQKGGNDKAAEKAADEAKAKIGELENRLRSIKTETPGFDQLLANAVGEAALYVLDDGPTRTKLDYRPGEARDLPVHLRGNPANEGRVIPRGFIEVLSPNSRKQFQKGSGRLELAEAIVNEGGPLSARVIVNRIWEQHFGRGLVDTPSNFGERGSRPTHPELLDDLTARFMQSGWSLKWLHREIMLSAAYQQSSAFLPGNHQADPENRLLWRMNRRRLEVEAWRDAILAAAGNLDSRQGGAPRDLGDASNTRRTIYGMVSRTRLNDMLRLYDFPDPSIHGEQRIATTTPTQQLFVLNSDFIQRQAVELFHRLKRECGTDRHSRVQQAHQWLFGRSATHQEIAWANDFIKPERLGGDGEDHAWQLYLHALFGSNEFMFID